MARELLHRPPPGDAKHAFQKVVSTQFGNFDLQITKTFLELFPGHFAKSKATLQFSQKNG